MSAVNSVLQSNAVHVMTDGLAYTDDYVPGQVDCRKAHVVGSLKAVVASTGPSLIGEFMANCFADVFDTFDGLIEVLPEVVEETFTAFADNFKDGDSVANVTVAGWHEAANKPAVYTIDCVAGTKKLDWLRSHETRELPADSVPFFTVQQPEYSFLPIITAEQIKAADFVKAFVAQYDQWNPAIDLLHALEIQRRSLFAGRHYVGGHAELTSITAAGVTQQIVHKWTDDEVGKVITVKPINWATWRGSIARLNSNVDFDGLSRLQRERMLKKAKKGKLR